MIRGRIRSGDRAQTRNGARGGNNAEQIHGVACICHQASGGAKGSIRGDGVHVGVICRCRRGKGCGEGTSSCSVDSHRLAGRAVFSCAEHEGAITAQRELIKRAVLKSASFRQRSGRARNLPGGQRQKCRNTPQDYKK